MCEPPPPVPPVFAVPLGAFCPAPVPPVVQLFQTVCVCDGICVCDSVVAAADKPEVVIVGVWFANTVEKAVVPPAEPPVDPDTTRNVLSLFVTDLVQPVGAVA